MEPSKSQLVQYIPVVMLAVVAFGFAGGTILASGLIGARGRRSRVKDMAYECGMLPVGEGSPRLSVKFYLVAMLFILFDVEVVFLYPWAVVFKRMLRDTGPGIVISMFIFMFILFLGYFYALKKDAFNWKQ